MSIYDRERVAALSEAKALRAQREAEKDEAIRRQLKAGATTTEVMRRLRVDCSRVRAIREGTR